MVERERGGVSSRERGVSGRERYETSYCHGDDCY